MSTSANRLSDYTQEELVNTLTKQLSHFPSKVVFITADLSKLGRCDIYSGKKFMNKILLLDFLYNTIINLHPGITIVVPSLTLNLCNTDIPYSRNTYTTMGAFSNYILQKPESYRSLHPFTSYTAIGPLAEFICTENGKFSYGYNSPYDRIFSIDDHPTIISIGKKPNYTCSVVHHAEFMAHVPYRYIKEFNHPTIKENGEKHYDLFYLHVLYREMDFERNLNIRAFEYFNKMGGVVFEEKLGKSSIYAYDLKRFFESTLELYLSNPYAWMEKEPKNKVYTL